MRTSPARISGTEKRLFADLRELVLSAKRRVAATVNSEIVLLYWSIGMRIKTDILKNRRAAYGEELVLRVATFLSDEFGSGWGFQTVRHCVRAAYTFRKKEIVYALRTQLTWTHLRSLMAIDDKLKRQFYLEMCAHEHWSTREMDAKIDSLLYERTAISGKRTSASRNTSPDCPRKPCSSESSNAPLQSHNRKSPSAINPQP